MLQSLGRLHFSMIVAMLAVRMVQVPADEIVRVIAVGNRLMSAVRAVRVS